MLKVVVFQENRTAGRHGGHAYQGFHGRAELIAEGAPGRVLHEAQFLGLDPKARRDHGVVEDDADALGVNGEASLFIEIGKATSGSMVRWGCLWR